MRIIWTNMFWQDGSNHLHHAIKDTSSISAGNGQSLIFCGIRRNESRHTVPLRSGRRRERVFLNQVCQHGIGLCCANEQHMPILRQRFFHRHNFHNIRQIILNSALKLNYRGAFRPGKRSEHDLPANPIMPCFVMIIHAHTFLTQILSLNTNICR